MKPFPLGEFALMLKDLDAPADRIAAALNRRSWPVVLEAVASYDAVGVYFEVPWEGKELEEHWPAVLREALEDRVVGTLREIPVCYALGPDGPAAAEALGLTTEVLAATHAGAVYRCYALGFCPGFPYLGYLPDAIAGLARLPQPRVRVEPGMVGITGRQTGIYPLERPGGWWLIGRTPLDLAVDLETGYFPLTPGDSVRFVPIGEPEFEARFGERLGQGASS